MIMCYKSLSNRKCKFAKDCKLYSEDSFACNHEGDYYGKGRKAGCFRTLNNQKNKTIQDVMSKATLTAKGVPEIDKTPDIYSQSKSKAKGSIK